MDLTGSESCPVAGFDIGGVEPLRSATRELFAGLVGWFVGSLASYLARNDPLNCTDFFAECLWLAGWM
jgi:hypothetical protein